MAAVLRRVRDAHRSRSIGESWAPATTRTEQAEVATTAVADPARDASHIWRWLQVAYGGVCRWSAGSVGRPLAAGLRFGWARRCSLCGPALATVTTAEVIGGFVSLPRNISTLSHRRRARRHSAVGVPTFRRTREVGCISAGLREFHPLCCSQARARAEPGRACDSHRDGTPGRVRNRFVTNPKDSAPRGRETPRGRVFTPGSGNGWALTSGQCRPRVGQSARSAAPAPRRLVPAYRRRQPRRR